MFQVIKVCYIGFLIFFLVGCGGGTSSTPTTENEVEVSEENNSSTNETENKEQTVEMPIVNEIPVAIEQKITTNEEELKEIILSATDANDDNLTFTIVTQPVNGILSGTAPHLIYTPNIDYAGEDGFSFKVNDGELDSKEVSVSIEILPVNDTPLAENLTISLVQDSNKTFTLAAYDSDDNNLTYVIQSLPKHGQLSGIAPELIYTPTSSYIGDDSFTYKVNDGKVDSEITDVNITVLENEKQSVTISGKVTYDLIPVQSTQQGLDYNNITAQSVKLVLVELLNSSNQVLQSTSTDENGSYSFEGITPSTEVKVRVYAKMLKSGSPSWDVKVVDNTSSSALYGLEGSLVSSGTQNSIRNLHASSGWTGSGYGGGRAAAPFAILNVVYQSMQNILKADSVATFPPLVVNWSTRNTATSGTVENGQIITSHYQEGNLYILGDANSDTDEYDTHVIAHEWGHYYEDKFSRTDSLGGSHGNGDVLDIRVAFGEGFGNAIAAMTLNNPIYFDTLGFRQSSGWSMDIESGTGVNSGWYSESSIQRILYDVFDTSNDGNDDVSLGFKPLHQVFVGAQKNTPAFTSLFSFITALKSENSENSDAIDTLITKEGIDTITDIYGSGRSLLSNQNPYMDLVVDTTLSTVCTTNSYGNLGSRNKLSNHKYIKFTVASAGDYKIKVERNNGTGSDPDFTLYRTSPFTYVGTAESPTEELEQVVAYLPASSYLLDVSDWNTQENACFNVSVESI
ncbi:MAG: cadherin-like domain-containing protein [Epsilonproteobacteria bacterium]|nr:cadherin-like domain-containing protein [Campylobacterota bacterium]